MLQEILAADSGWINRDPFDDDWYASRGATTHAGVDISPETAMRFSTVFACIQKNSKTLASLPVRVYERTAPHKTKAVEHELNDILTWNGNQNATGISVRSSMVANRLGWGNGVAEISYTNDGKVGALTPLMSKYLRPVMSDGGELLWEHWPEGRFDTTLPPDKYIHDPGPFVINGLLGVTPIAAKETIGGAIAAQTFTDGYFGNGAVPGGFLEFPADIDLDDERQDSLVETFNETWRGADKAHKVGRLREGVTFKQIGMKLEEMQLIDLRKFSRIEICSIFDTPPVMIQELDPGKYTAIEQAMIMWVRDSLLPAVKATEAAYKKRFFPDSNLYVRHNLAGLARGDMKARGEFYQKGIQNGWFKVDDVREMEELNPVPGGDQNWIQQSMMPLTAGGQVVPPQQQGDGQAARRQQPVIVVNVTGDSQGIDGEAIGRQVSESVTKSLDRKPDAGAFLPLLENAAMKIVARETTQTAAARKRHAGDPDGYAQWCVRFFGGYQEYIRAEIEPIVRSLERVTQQTAGERPAEFADRYAKRQLTVAYELFANDEPLDTDYLLSELKATYLMEPIPCQN